ncbi:uncharacterized protein EDB93DRAFT_1100863 [Suillus bovinus]|uniref:uncharacterized protein n=1 Tax=Suillus bovinus TaxID=48563 RepID=UPI001B862388|nr:uncharacterized protein EDB93DRAFT_1100863 [Suillus bovinus]KAG2158086.1 hypothetical protein EDB93DRAFT_1100863 [Suillus bovinus]
MELISQFTEDAIAKEDCAPCYYVATIVPGQPGRFIWGVCYLQYSQKLSTLVRPSSVHSSAQPQSLPDPCIIHQSMNAAQRKSLHTWAAVQAQTLLCPLAAYKGNSRKKIGHDINFGNICEGKKDIDACLDTPGLITITLDTILPKILAFGKRFPWRTEEFVVWDASWVDLSGHLPAILYFLSQCLVQSRCRPKTTTFKTKQFSLMVVVPAAQWSEYEAWLDKTEEEISQNTLLEQLQRHRFINTGTKQDPRTSGTNSEDPWAAQQDEDPFGPDLEGPDALSTVERNSTVTWSDSSAHNRPDALSTAGPQHSHTCPSAKHAHFRAESDSTNSTVSSPHKKPVHDVFHLPDHNDLREALKSGGSVDAVRAPKVYDLRNEDIQFHQIPVHPLADILKTPQYRSFKPNISNSLIGQLTIDVPLRSMIGIGAFKTAHPGGLGSRAQQDVVIKWLLHRPPSHAAGASTLKISPYTLPDEHTKLLNESNALLNKLPWQMSGQGCFQRYLLEGRVMMSDTPDNQTFMKFIHNKDYGPSLDEDEYGYDLAVFLAFTQHIQYAKTEGLAFISDYQDLDPPLCFSSSVSEGSNIFGNGNMVDDFEAKHLCNHYCKWPGFGLEFLAVHTRHILIWSKKLFLNVGIRVLLQWVQVIFRCELCGSAALERPDCGLASFSLTCQLHWSLPYNLSVAGCGLVRVNVPSAARLMVMSVKPLGSVGVNKQPMIEFSADRLL